MCDICQLKGFSSLKVINNFQDIYDSGFSEAVWNPEALLNYNLY